MVFAPDTEFALQSAAALINTAETDDDALATTADLDRFILEQQVSGSRTGTQAELDAMRSLRQRLREIWTASEDEAVTEVNSILRDAGALPQLMKHDHWDWHLHATPPEAALDVRIAVEAAMALADVIRSGEMDRLRICAAEDCTAVVLDLSRNRSRKYCDTGNCANRAHVRAYRGRMRA